MTPNRPSLILKNRFRVLLPTISFERTDRVAVRIRILTYIYKQMCVCVCIPL